MTTRAQLERRREELAARVAELHWDLGGLAYEMAIRDHFRNDVLLHRAAQLQELDTELAEVERMLGDAGAAGEDESGGAQARKAWAARAAAGADPPALLLVVFLGFGVAVGMAAKGTRSRIPPVRKVLIAQAPPPASTTTTPTATPPSSQPGATPAPAPGGGESSTEGEPAKEGGGGKSAAAKTNAPAAGKPATKPSSSTPSSHIWRWGRLVWRRRWRIRRRECGGSGGGECGGGGGGRFPLGVRAPPPVRPSSRP